MGAVIDHYIFEAGEFSSIREAYDSKYQQLEGYSWECEGYSGTIADCEPPRRVSGPKPGQTVRERVYELYDDVPKRESVGFEHEGCIVLVYCAPE